MEQPPRTPEGGEHHNNVNSYGTDDPTRQASIEAARQAASEERRRNRERLEHLVELGVSAEDAETIIEAEETGTLPASHRPELERDLRDQLLPGQSPRIFVSCVAAAEAGHVHGAWIDAAQPLPFIQEEVMAMLFASPVADADRYAVDDHRGFGSYTPSPETPLAILSAIAEGIARYGDAYQAYLTVVDTNDLEAVQRFADRHVGSYDSAEAWARAVGEDLGWQQQLDRVVPSDLRPYVRIDYDKFLRDAYQHWDVAEDPDGRIHIFLR